MATEIEIAYCAGLIDGEGYIGVKKSKAYRNLTGRVTPGYHAILMVRMVNAEGVCFLAETRGGWYYPETPRVKYGRLLHTWQISDKKAELALRLVLPYLRIKRENAETVIALRDLQAEGRQHRTKITGYRNFPNARGTPRLVANKCFSDEYVARCDVFWLRCKELNRRGVQGGCLV